MDAPIPVFFSFLFAFCNALWFIHRGVEDVRSVNAESATGSITFVDNYCPNMVVFYPRDGKTAHELSFRLEGG